MVLFSPGWGMDVAVVFNQVAARKAGGELFDYLLHLTVFQPRVDDRKLLAQHRQHDRPGEALVVAVTRMLFAVEVDYIPTQSVKLIKQGFST